MFAAAAILLGLAASPSNDYLCEIYKRTPIKQDASGDFTWKDKAAADRRNMDLCEYVVGGMNPKLRSALIEFGKVAFEAGIPWSFSSGFRDDWRQSIASGYKARTGNSLHGGSRRTGGYGDGRAVDLSGPVSVLELFDSVGGKLGLIRPMKASDPAHIQLVGINKIRTKRHRRRS